MDAEKSLDVRREFVYFIALGITLFAAAVVQDIGLFSVC
mgnify:CR=1 FL=1